ncbi:MAG: outer membrane beta-barrel protein [Terracidiphilus sp.]|jgi:hypothetical protein
MRRLSLFLFSILLFAGTVAAGAQVVPSAAGRQVSITVGGMASAFQPDFAGVWNSNGVVAQADPRPLYGVGAYVDVKLRRWVQFEAEARWLRWNQYKGIYQDNYLIGPRLPVYRFWKATVYGKALAGYSKMSFDPVPGDTGKFTDIAFGGGMDVKLTKRISLRVPDVEYQYYPYINSPLSPYGVSVGVGYKIF